MSNPRVCMSCGADPDRDPTTHEELPIVVGALDAQEAALRDKLATLEADLAALRRVERGDMHAECNHNRERGHRWRVVDEVNERIGWGSSLLWAVADADSKEQQR